jgi:hypothetical protein
MTSPTGDKPPAWLLDLLSTGLLEQTHADYMTAHFRIHRVAWREMQRYPDQYFHIVPWPKPPWTLEMGDDPDFDVQIEKERKKLKQ